MKALKNIFSLLVTIAIAMYLIFAPGIIMENVKRSILAPWQLPEESFTGIINVWHIVRFKAHTGSVSTWVEKRASEFEKKHFGIFVTVEAMTLEEYAEKRERGEKADIYSFPLGLEYEDAYKPLDETTLNVTLSYFRDGFLSLGKSEGKLYALPYMYSGYCLIANTDMLEKSGVILEEDSTDEQIKAQLETITKTQENAICGDAVAARLFGIDTPVGAYEDFTSGKSPFAMSDFRAVGDCERRLSAGKGFMTSTYTQIAYTDEVQFVALDKDIADEKLPYAYEILTSFFSDDAQALLSQMNAYPVIAFDDLEKRRDEYSSVAYDAFSLYCEPDIPNCFLYKRYYDELVKDAELSLAGDKDAQLRFDERLSELIR